MRAVTLALLSSDFPLCLSFNSSSRFFFKLTKFPTSTFFLSSFPDSPTSIKRSSIDSTFFCFSFGRKCGGILPIIPFKGLFPCTITSRPNRIRSSKPPIVENLRKFSSKEVIIKPISSMWDANITFLLLFLPLLNAIRFPTLSSLNEIASFLSSSFTISFGFFSLAETPSVSESLFNNPFNSSMPSPVIKISS
ncbi:hypothetical protein ES703_28599 [subsurface metagenome]